MSSRVHSFGTRTLLAPAQAPKYAHVPLVTRPVPQCAVRHVRGAKGGPSMWLGAGRGRSSCTVLAVLGSWITVVWIALAAVYPVQAERERPALCVVLDRSG